jgi:hypothetical protein
MNSLGRNYVTCVFCVVVRQRFIGDDGHLQVVAAEKLRVKGTKLSWKKVESAV